MPSSNSGSLSRSQFFRLAAGALLSLVGWRLSAAAAPELAQSGGARGTKDAAGRMGAILVSEFGAVKIHSYLARGGKVASPHRALSCTPPTAFRSIRR
jgi:hypothetical protein